jgi:hypothetical protein
MNSKRTRFIVIVSLCGLVVVIASVGIWIVRGDDSNNSPASSASFANTPTPIFNDFFSQEFSSSTDIVPIRGLAVGGLGDALLKSNVWNSLVNYEREKNCAKVTSEAISVEQINEAGEYWVENWTVKACGKTEVFKVKFTPDQVGGTIYSFVP